MNFNEFAAYVKRNEPNIAGNLYICSKFLIGLNSNPQFRALPDPSSPARLSMVRLVVVKSGWYEPIINSKKYRCGPGDLLFINWGVTISGDSIGVETIIDGFALSEEFMKTVFNGNLPQVFLSPGKCIKLHLEENESSVIQEYLKTMYNLVQISSINSKTINALFVAIFSLVESFYSIEIPLANRQWTRHKETVERFIRLVNDNIKQEHKLEFYASQLYMTTHYLGIVIKNETGTTAREWIDKELTIQLEQELKYTNKSLKAIATEYNFNSLSSFCKFFKRRTGVTAGTYRTEGNLY